MQKSILALLGVLLVVGNAKAELTPMHFVVRSHQGHGTDYYGQVEKVEYASEVLSALPEALQTITVYCSTEWTGLVAELGGKFYGLNGKARGRDISVVDVGGKSATVLSAYEKSDALEPYGLATIPLIRPALTQCRH